MSLDSIVAQLRFCLQTRRKTSRYFLEITQKMRLLVDKYLLFTVNKLISILPYITFSI